MNFPRLSVAQLLGIVLIFACTCAALRSASAVWTNAVASVTFILLLTGVSGAWFAKGMERAFWAGFALFGITYLVLVNWDWIGGQFGHDLSGSIGDLAECIFPPTPPLPRAPGSFPPSLTPAMMRDAQLQTIRLGNFIQIGRLVLSLVFALIGGLVARGFAARTASRNDS